MSVSTSAALGDPRPITRRRALLLAAALLLPARAAAQDVARAPGHPEPRPGVTAARVLPPGQVPERAREAYDAAREIPEVLDGLYCHCHCAERHEELRSLLSCFESDMPLRCGVCTGEAKLALRLARQGKSLDEIRAEIDKTYG